MTWAIVQLDGAVGEGPARSAPGSGHTRPARFRAARALPAVGRALRYPLAGPSAKCPLPRVDSAPVAVAATGNTLQPTD